VLFPAGDAGALAGTLLQLFDRRELWPEMRANARRFVERERNWAGSVARYRDVYGALAPRVIAA
jgi:glycosyltransferase involved in cell wall biosynthesis